MHVGGRSRFEVRECRSTWESQQASSPADEGAQRLIRWQRRLCVSYLKGGRKGSRKVNWTELMNSGR